MKQDGVWGRYADKLVEHAKQMLEFGIEHPGSYMKSKLEGLKDHGKHYPSTNYNDEMALGAVWLYFATGVRTPNILKDSLKLCMFLTHCSLRSLQCVSMYSVGIFFLPSV